MTAHVRASSCCLGDWHRPSAPCRTGDTEGTNPARETAEGCRLWELLICAAAAARHSESPQLWITSPVALSDWENICHKMLQERRRDAMIPLKHGQKIWIDTSPEKTYTWSISELKDAQRHQASGTCKPKPPMRAHFLFLRMAGIKGRTVSRSGIGTLTHSLLLGMEDGTQSAAPWKANHSYHVNQQFHS